MKVRKKSGENIKSTCRKQNKQTDKQKHNKQQQFKNPHTRNSRYLEKSGEKLRKAQKTQTNRESEKSVKPDMLKSIRQSRKWQNLRYLEQKTEKTNTTNKKHKHKNTSATFGKPSNCENPEA